MPQIARRESKIRRELERALDDAATAIRALRKGDGNAAARTEDTLEDIALLRGGTSREEACRFVQEQRFLLEDGDRFLDEVGERAGWSKWRRE